MFQRRRVVGWVEISPGSPRDGAWGGRQSYLLEMGLLIWCLLFLFHEIREVNLRNLGIIVRASYSSIKVPFGELRCSVYSVGLCCSWPCLSLDWAPQKSATRHVWRNDGNMVQASLLSFALPTVFQPKLKFDAFRAECVDGGHRFYLGTKTDVRKQWAYILAGIACVVYLCWIQIICFRQVLLSYNASRNKWYLSSPLSRTVQTRGYWKLLARNNKPPPTTFCKRRTLVINCQEISGLSNQTRNFALSLFIKDSVVKSSLCST